MISGIKITFFIFVVSSIVSLLLGTAIAVMRISRIRVLNVLGNAYVKLFQNIPVLFWILFFYYVFPQMLPFKLGNTLNANSYYPIISGILALTLDSASYISDILRGGRLLLPQTVRDVAISQGLSRIQQYLYVLLPQMFRVTLPPLGTRIVYNFKNTALCMVVTAQELTWATQQIGSLSFRGVEAIIAATLFYIGVSMLIASLVIILERHWKIDAKIVTASRTLIE